MVSKSANRILVISDNAHLIERFRAIIVELNQPLQDAQFEFACSKKNVGLQQELHIPGLDVKHDDLASITTDFDLVISLHCKQIFPAEMVQAVRCVNVHPGLNPYNRGWFPQVFSIMNGLPLGATIHEIDEQVDHGPIIAQREVSVRSDDTSLTCYERVLEAECELLYEFLPSIVANSYVTMRPAEGNYNSLADFRELCQLDMHQTVRAGDLINRLRALTHGDYHNAFFIDEQGEKVFVSLSLERTTPRESECKKTDRFQQAVSQKASC